MMERSNSRAGHIVGVVTGYKEWRFRQTGMFFLKKILILFSELSKLNSRGHVWYAVDEDDMTEKVGSSHIAYLSDIALMIHAALLRMAALENRDSCRRRGLAGVLCKDLGLVEQHRTDFCAICLEVSPLHIPFAVFF